MYDSIYNLSKGGHPKALVGQVQERCAMEWISYMCGEPHGDSPTTVSEVMRSVMILINDHLGDVERQQLRPYLTRCIGTRGDNRDMGRAECIGRWVDRHHGSASRYPQSNVYGRVILLGEVIKRVGLNNDVRQLLDELLPLESLTLPQVQPAALPWTTAGWTKFMDDNITTKEGVPA
jgi:hypothetical protein